MDDIELIEYSGASKPITYMCKRCKRQYSKTRANHLYENKTLCLFCNSPHDSKIRKWIINFLKETKKFKLIEWHGNTGERIKLQCLDCGSIFDKSLQIYFKELKTQFVQYVEITVALSLMKFF